MNNIIFFNKDSIVVLAAIFVLGVFIYTFYKYIFTPVHNTSNTNVGLFNKFKLKLTLIKLSSVGTVSTIVNSSTVVKLTDEDLNSLLEFVFREIGNSNQIPLELLKSLGLHTPTVIIYLQSLGYIVL
jgi:hypothetical protein